MSTLSANISPKLLCIITKHIICVLYFVYVYIFYSYHDSRKNTKKSPQLFHFTSWCMNILAKPSDPCWEEDCVRKGTITLSFSFLFYNQRQHKSLIHRSDMRKEGPDKVHWLCRDLRILLLSFCIWTKFLFQWEVWLLEWHFVSTFTVLEVTSHSMYMHHIQCTCILRLAEFSCIMGPPEF
jgi:hypothetical protein